MKASPFTKIGVTIGAAALLATAIATPALADPPNDGSGNPTYGELVGLGSDTTQDIVNGLALAIGDDLLASYNSVGSTTVVTRPGGPNVPRASGSGGGRDELRVAIGQSSTINITTPGGSIAATKSNVVGQIDFARSSSGPSSGDLSSTGVLAYVPFARDAVAVAVSETSPLAVVPWIKGDATTAGSTTPSLYNVYRGDVRYAYISGSAGSYTYVGVGNSSTAPDGATAYAIQALLPQSGSGTRSYFIGQVGLTEANITSINTATPNTIKSVYGGSNTPVQEHDGSALVGDDTAIVPFSIGQWVAQANGVEGVSDRRHGAVLAAVGGVAPTTEAEGVFQTNPAYSAMVRDVYNIVPSRELDDPTSATYAMFRGTTSLICQQSATITEYGFQLMPGTTAASTCGYPLLRAYTASVSTTTLALNTTSVEAGDTATATVTVTSTHDQGGTVVILDAADTELATGEIPADSTSVEISVPFSEVGDLQVRAEFVPRLAGIAGSVSSDVEVSVAGRATALSLSAPAAPVTGATVPVIAWLDEADPEGGVVTLRDGTTVLATVTLGAGENAAYLPFVAKKASYSLEATYAPPAESTYLGSTATKSLTVGKGTPTLSIPTPASVKANKKGVVTVTVVGVTGAVPTGTVTVSEGSRVLVASKAVVGGKAVVTLPLLKKGTHTLTITYNGDGLWNTVTKTVRIKIT